MMRSPELSRARIPSRESQLGSNNPEVALSEGDVGAVSLDAGAPRDILAQEGETTHPAFTACMPWTEVISRSP